MQPGVPPHTQQTPFGGAQPQYAQPQPQLVGVPTVGTGIPMGTGYPATQATLALVLSIMGLVLCGCFTAIPALILANNALLITNQIPGHPDGGLAKAAQILSWVVIALWSISILIYGVVGIGLLALGISAQGA